MTQSALGHAVLTLLVPVTLLAPRAAHATCATPAAPRPVPGASCDRDRATPCLRGPQESGAQQTGAQQSGAQQAAPTAMTRALRREVIAGVIARLREGYVFPEKVAAMSAALEARERRGEYDDVADPRAFADSLGAHLRAVAHDANVRVLFNPSGILVPDGRGAPTPALRDQQRAAAAADHFGVGSVDTLPGNVGYVDFRHFYDAAYAEDAVADAMTAVADADALVIDLRNHLGGDPAAVALVASYVFGDTSVLLNTLRTRGDPRAREFWTQRTVRGRRFGADKPVFVVTSRRTASGGEELAYDLSALGRATIVGERTAGVSHSGWPRRVTDHFAVFVPAGRPVNPVTHTDWEGIGVEPDIAVPASMGREVAHRKALEALIGRTRDPAERMRLAETLSRLRALGTSLN